MHGLIFVTFENFVRQKYGQAFLTDVREYARSKGGPLNVLIHTVYTDELLLEMLSYVCDMQHIQPDAALEAYGKYYITNELTSYQCAYLLQQVNTARDLLLTMSQAHRQMHAASDMVYPPLFGYEFDAVQEALVLTYRNQRKLCSLLRGAIHGAAELYGEQVAITEIECMKRGAPACRFRLVFSRSPNSSIPQVSQSNYHRVLADSVLAALPISEPGITLQEVPQALRQRYGWGIDIRPALLYQALTLLLNAGLVSTTLNPVAEGRRYWRAPKSIAQREVTGTLHQGR